MFHPYLSLRRLVLSMCISVIRAKGAHNLVQYLLPFCGKEVKRANPDLNQSIQAQQQFKSQY